MTPKPLYWQYCPKCGAVIALNHYPFNESANYTDDIWRELDALLERHQCPPDTAVYKNEIETAPPVG